MKKILIIEDEDPIRMAMEDDFILENYIVEVASDGLEGMAKAADPAVDLIILDIMLPGMNGYDVCKELRRQGINTPIIMLTARGQEIDRVLGLELGADDYVTKPFSPRELQARVKAVLRRMGKKDENSEVYGFRSDELEVDFKKYECRIRKRKVHLTAHEFRLLKYLIMNRGRVIDRQELLDEVWGNEVVVSPRTVDTHMANLRKKIEDNPAQSGWIISTRGIGYQFQAPEA